MNFKKVISTIIICFLGINLSSAEKKVTNENNEYGGTTETFIFDYTEKEYEQFSEVSFFYNGDKEKQKVVYILSDKIEKNTGYCIQEEIYENGCLAAYKMIFSDDGKYKYGVTEIIEKINEQNQVVEYWYSNGKKIAKTSGNSFTLNYGLYSLTFLENEFELEECGKDQILFSAKFQLVRSFVKFDGKFSKLSNRDKYAIKMFSDFLNNSALIDLYTCKSKVYSNGKEYTVYIQKKLIPYLQKDMDFLMAYGIMGLDGNLVLFMTEFSEMF